MTILPGRSSNTHSGMGFCGGGGGCCGGGAGGGGGDIVIISCACHCIRTSTGKTRAGCSRIMNVTQKLIKGLDVFIVFASSTAQIENCRRFYIQIFCNNNCLPVIVN